MNEGPPDLSRLSEDAISFGSKPAEAMPADPEWGSELPMGLAAPDERWQDDMVGTKSDLEDVVRGFRLHDETPEKVARMLLTSRNLFIHSYFVHEFAFVGAVWSVFAVEAALKDLLDLADDDRTNLTELTGRAQGRGWLTADEGERLRYGAKMRNALVHARAQGTFTVGIALSILEASHELVTRLYEANARQALGRENRP